MKTLLAMAVTASALLAQSPIPSTTTFIDFINAVNAALATKTAASIVPNTPPTAGQILIGNAGGTAYAPVTLSGDATVSSAGVVALNGKLKLWSQDITLFDPVMGDSGRIKFRLPFAGTVTSLACNVDAVATSVTINLDARAIATPNTAGTAVLTSGLACDSASAETTTITQAKLAAGVPVALTISGVTGTPATVNVTINGTID